MRAPNKVLVGASTFAIEHTDDITDYGDTLLDKSRIRIRKGMGADAERDTVLHEVLHVVFEQVGLAFELKEDDLEEKYVRRVTPALLDLLRRNPRLVSYLTS